MTAGTAARVGSGVSGHPALRVRGIRKAYGERTALGGVDLDVARGEVVGLLGQNGAGKSTLVSIVAGLLRPDAGSVAVAGTDVALDPVAGRRNLGLAPQETGVYPDVSVRDNLRLFGALAGLGRRAVRSRITDVADAFALGPLLDRPAGRLSGGERRRVHTAAAVLHRPALLLLDEPTVGADVAGRDALLGLVRQLADEGAGVCYTTHYLPEIETLDARVAILHGGRILADGPVDEVVAAHATSAVELAFDGEAPLMAGAEITGEVARVPTSDPARTAAELLGGLRRDELSRLRSLEFVRDDLESAYRALVDPSVHADMEEVAA